MSGDQHNQADPPIDLLAALGRAVDRAREARRTPDYIVLRAHPSARTHTPPEVEGRWYDRGHIPVGYAPPGPLVGGITASRAVATPTGRFEVRDDGAVAEVWEIRIAPEGDAGGDPVSDEQHNHQWATDTHFGWGGGYHLVTHCTVCPARSACPCAELSS